MSTQNRNICICDKAGGDALTILIDRFFDLSSEAFNSSTQQLGVICSRLVENTLTTAPRIIISGSLVTDGGLPAMDYAGASENSVVLRTAANNSWLAGSDFSVFCVANSDVASRTQYIWTNDVGTTGKKRGLFAQATDELRFIFWSSPAQEA